MIERWKATFVLCATLVLVGGCIVIPPLSATEVENPNLRFTHTYTAAPNIVYRKLLKVVERNDREIIQADEVALTLKIQWPFNLLVNRYRGKALIRCEPAENGTRVLIGGYSERADHALSWIVARQIFDDLTLDLSSP